MALAIDGSSPGVATQTSSSVATLTTSSFTPPSNSLLLIGWAGNTGTNSDPSASPTITDSLGTHLTYTALPWKHRGDASPAVDGQAAMWWAKVGTSAAMTVTVTTGTGTGAQEAALKVWVITGQDPTTPITTANGKSGSTSAASIAQSYTAQATGGWGFIAVCDWSEVGAETAGTGCASDGSANVVSAITYGFMRRSVADDSNGVSNTLNVTLPATSNNLNWVYAEVKPAAGAASSPTESPLVVGPPNLPVPIPKTYLSSSFPLGNPAVPTPGPLVVTTPWVPKVPGAVITSNPAAPVVAATSTPNTLVVSPPCAPVPIPEVSITASQPLGNPAVPTPEPLVVTPPFTPVPIPGARISSTPPAPVVSTVGTPGPLVVGPPNTPVPVPKAYLSASQPLGNPAVGTPAPLVVSTFTLAPVPGAQVFAAPQAPAAPAVPTPGPLVVTPPYVPVPIPKTFFSASFPLGNPATSSPQPMVVSPAHRWTRPHPAILSGTVSPTHLCITPRPSTGTTARPSSGTTVYALATTGRPNTGTTTRPNTGTTQNPC